jgi:transposase
MRATPGQAGDSTQLLPLLGALRIPRLGPGRPRTRPAALRGDKAYSSRGHRTHLRARGITAVIPEPADQDYKQRNVIERAFNRLEQWRGIATRYDKHALAYGGAVVLASILLWLR